MAAGPFYTNSTGNTMLLLSRISELNRQVCRREDVSKTGRQTRKGGVGGTEMFMYRSSVTFLWHLGKRFCTPFRRYLEEI